MKNNNNDIWEPFITGWDNLDKDAGNLILSEAKEQYNDTITVYEGFKKSTNTIIKIASTYIITSLSYLYTGEDTYLSVAAGLLCFLGVVAILLVIKSVFPQNLCAPGRDPMLLYTEEIVRPEEEPPLTQYNNLIANLIYHLRIDSQENRKLLEVMAGRCRRAYIILSLAVFLIPIGFLGHWVG